MEEINNAKDGRNQKGTCNRFWSYWQSDEVPEFDYAGTQACRSLKEEGMEVILVNSNPATIMTDKDIADKVYIEPLTTEVLQHIIEVEKPDSLLPNMGGQAGLNLGMELAESGFLE